MIDIAELHRKSDSKKILGKFFVTSSCKKAIAYLESTGIKEVNIVQKRRAYSGVVGVAKVHQLLVTEYLRWVDYEAYAKSHTKGK